MFRKSFVYATFATSSESDAIKDATNLDQECYRRTIYKVLVESIIDYIQKMPSIRNFGEYDIYKIKTYIAQLYMEIITDLAYNQRANNIIFMHDGLLNYCTREQAQTFTDNVNYHFKSYSATLTDFVFDKVNEAAERIKFDFACTKINILSCIVSGNTVKLKYDDISFELELGYYNALKNKNIDEAAIFAILCRYDTLDSGANQFIANLKKKAKLQALGFKRELFASALNSYFEEYHSLFPDIEPGSFGPFSAYEKIDVPFMANPPYVLGLLEKMYEIVLNSPTMSIMSLPLWDDYGLIKRVDKDDLFIARRILEESFHIPLSNEKKKIPPYISYLFVPNSIGEIKKILEVFESKPTPNVFTNVFTNKIGEGSEGSEHMHINVIDDSVLKCGTKERAMYEFLLQKVVSKKNTFIGMSGSSNGLGMVAFSEAIGKLKKKHRVEANIYTQKTNQIFKSLEYIQNTGKVGVRVVDGQFRKIYEVLERDLKDKRRNAYTFEVTLGGDDDLFMKILYIKLRPIVQCLNIPQNAHMFIAYGSGTLYRVLSKIRSDIVYHLVVIGKKPHNIRDTDILHFHKTTLYTEMPDPGFPTVLSYDAKAYYESVAFKKRNADLSIYMWNVGSYDYLSY